MPVFGPEPEALTVYGADKSYILHALPQNYQLYEHIKSKSGDSETKSKNHAGGGHDRQDAYLYGHPSGRKKRFRSPADFFPHLLWLATDPKGDPLNCACKICSPDDLQPEVPKEAKPAAQAIKKEIPQTPVPLPNKATVVEVQIPAKRPSSSNGPKQPASTVSASPLIPNPAPQIAPSSTPTQALAPNPSAGTTRPSAPATPVPAPVPAPSPTPAPLAQPRNADQQLDAYYNRLVYRAGELVWYNKVHAWGLGVIARRWWAGENGQRETRGYLIQQLSHPLHHPPQVHIADEKDMRPWLAWSAPQYTNDMLNKVNITYEKADWDGILGKRYGQGDAEVDGSILAARGIDARYTLGEMIRKRQLNQSAEIRFHNSIFLGGEKIWVGEPVRIRLGTGSDMMVVNTIEARAQTAGPNTGINGVSLCGDIYHYVTVPHNPQASIPSDKLLPLRVREDLRYRNSVTIPTRRLVSYWKLTASLARVDMADIKGRWYESSLLLPLLSENFYTNVGKGEIEDCNMWMNARGDASAGQSLQANGWSTREEALGRAVPGSFQLVEGHQQPFPEELAAITASMGNIHGQPHEQLMPDAGGFDQLMDLDAMDHSALPGFGQEYGVQDHFY